MNFNWLKINSINILKNDSFFVSADAMCWNIASYTVTQSFFLTISLQVQFSNKYGGQHVHIFNTLGSMKLELWLDRSFLHAYITPSNKLADAFGCPTPLCKPPFDNTGPKSRARALSLLNRISLLQRVRMYYEVAILLQNKEMCQF